MPKNRPVSMPLDEAKVCFLCRQVFNGDYCCGSRDWDYVKNLIANRKPHIFERTEDIPWMRNMPPLARRQAI